MSYALDNAAPQAAARFTELERLYDPVSVRQLDAVAPAPGWRCWELGAGGGSVAVELARRVAPCGHVYATDLDPRWTSADAHAAVEVLRHDVVTDPPPAAGLDLIHARLVASHLAAWPAVLTTLVAALAPGGWLLVEELDPMQPYQPDPRTPTDHLVNRVGDAFTRVLAGGGGNPHLGRALSAQLTAAGLADVTAEGTVVAAHGGDHPAARLMQANAHQTAADLMARSDLTPSDLERYVTAMTQPATRFNMPVFWAARGRKAAA